jgi:hypothetical protein
LKKKIEERVKDVEVLGVDSEEPGVFEVTVRKDGRQLKVHSKKEDGRVHL